MPLLRPGTAKWIFKRKRKKKKAVWRSVNRGPSSCLQDIWDRASCLPSACPPPAWPIRDSFKPKDCHQTPEISSGGKFRLGNPECCISVYVSWEKSYNQPRQHIRKQRDYLANKGPSSQRYGFSSSHVWMWELNNKESCAQRNWGFWTVVLEKTLAVLGLQGDPTSPS